MQILKNSFAQTKRLANASRVGVMLAFVVALCTLGAGGAMAASYSDNFNRSNQTLGCEPYCSNWKISQGYDKYDIVGNQVTNDGGNAGAAIWSGTVPFNHGASMKLVNIDETPDSGAEIDLVLTAEDWVGNECNMLEIVYDPNAGAASAWVCNNWGTWTQYGSTVSVSFADGDVFGAYHQDGVVTIYKNGVSQGTINMGFDYDYAATGFSYPRAGMWLLNSQDVVVDDFTVFW